MYWYLWNNEKMVESYMYTRGGVVGAVCVAMFPQIFVHIHPYDSTIVFVSRYECSYVHICSVVYLLLLSHSMRV
jgi:hypothetical protein